VFTMIRSAGECRIGSFQGRRWSVWDGLGRVWSIRNIRVWIGRWSGALWEGEIGGSLRGTGKGKGAADLLQLHHPSRQLGSDSTSSKRRDIWIGRRIRFSQREDTRDEAKADPKQGKGRPVNSREPPMTHSEETKPNTARTETAWPL